MPNYRKVRTIRYRIALYVAVCFVVLAANCHGAQILFQTGPDQLQFGPGGLPLNAAPGYADVDIFTFTSNSVLTQIGWSAWISSGNTPSTVDWAITTNLVGGCCALTGQSNVIASAIASLNNTLIATDVEPRFHENVYWSTFAVNVPLAAGTYYLWLGNVTPGLNVGGDPGWGYASNTGGASQQWLNGNLNFFGGGQQSFELDGTTTVVHVPTPEPSSLLLLGTGGLGVLGLLRGRGLRGRLKIRKLGLDSH